MRAVRIEPSTEAREENVTNRHTSFWSRLPTPELGGNPGAWIRPLWPEIVPPLSPSVYRRFPARPVCSQNLVVYWNQ
jgi:hypothetical protein